ncbi:uncharacterized protein LOC111591636, partial [Ceratitis capitata]|uniref:uncharacterized protein LOC111591636 n=1 Tax=Ceratitis capitata TaxID=7213 RepID=UPI000C6C64FE
MGKSPRRSPRLNSDTMDVNNPASTPATSNTAVKKSTSQNDTVTATIVAGTASAPSVAPTSTGTVSRNSSTPSTPGASTPISRQEAIMQAMQKRIAMLENSLKAAEVKLKEHESHIETVNASGSAYIAGMSAPQLPQIQQVVPLPDLQLPPNTGTNSQPLASLTDSRQLPISFATTTQNMYTNSDIHQSDNLSVNSNIPINANMGSVATHSSYLPRQMQALPDFCGKAEDWPMFYTAFTESTAVYGYSNFENNQRLHKCLKGEARETVKSLLIHPSNVNNIIEQLKFKFGRPEQLIRCQLAQVKEIAPITESGVLKLVSFATKVNNICIFLQSANGGDQHIANPTLLDDLVMKLPMSKRIEWATYAASIRPYATIVQFSQWLTRLANVISSVNDVELIRDPKRRVVLHAAESQRRQSCPICCGPHKTAECNKFIEFTVPRRWTETKNLRLCFSCLNAGHGTRTCQRRKPCSTEGCRRIHHKLLHEIAPLSTVTQRSSQEERQSGEESVLSCSTGFNNKKLLFRILPVVLYANHKRVETYALLDEGSSITMVDNALLQDLDLRGREQSLRLQWFGGRAAQEPAVVVDMFISGANMQKRHKLRNVYGVSNLQLPSQSLSRAELSCGDAYLRKLPVQTYSHIRPRLLIGLDHAHLGLPSFTMKMNRNGPFAANTALGWVVFGPTINEQQSSQLCLLMNNKRDNSLHKLVADYFDTESFGVRSSPPIESNVDVLARTILEKTSRCINGRFQIGLLWKHENVKLPNSYCMALRRLKSIENKMLRNVEFAAEYKRIIEYYIAKGYARKLSATKADLSSPRTWYLPHFAVSNPTGKLRLVFDAAAEVQGVSLKNAFGHIPSAYSAKQAALPFHDHVIGLYKATQRICSLMDKVIPASSRENVHVYLNDL